MTAQIMMIPEELDVFRVPHQRMKKLVDSYNDWVYNIDYMSGDDFNSMLQSLRATFAIFKSHESIENSLIINRLTEKMKETSDCKSQFVCDCHKDNIISEMIGLFGEGLMTHSAQDRINYGQKLCQELHKFTDVFLPHMKEEEEVFLPLLIKYFSYDELRKLTQDVINQHSVDIMDAPDIETAISDIKLTSEPYGFSDNGDIESCPLHSNKGLGLDSITLLALEAKDLKTDARNDTRADKRNKTESSMGEVEDTGSLGGTISSCHACTKPCHSKPVNLCMSHDIEQPINSISCDQVKSSAASSTVYICDKFLSGWNPLTEELENCDNVTSDWNRSVKVTNSQRVVKLATHSDFKSDRETDTGLAAMPGEILLEIFQWLPVTDLIRCGQVCPLWNSITKQPSLWRNCLPVQWAAGCWKQYECNELHGNEMMSEVLLLNSEDVISGKIEEGLKIERIINGLMEYVLPFVGEGVHKLKLNNSSAISDVMIQNLLKLCSNLDHVDLSTTSITDGAFKGYGAVDDIAKTRSVCKLQHLNLSGCRQITDKTIQYLCPAGVTTRLSFINLSGCPRITSQGLWRLAQCSPRLRPANLYYCDNVTDGPFSRDANGCANLEQSSEICCRSGH